MDWFCVVFIRDFVKLREDPFPQFPYVFSGETERCSCRVSPCFHEQDRGFPIESSVVSGTTNAKPFIREQSDLQCEDRSSKSAALLDSATVNETPSSGVYRMMGLADCAGQVRLPATGRKRRRVREREFLSLGRISELNTVGVKSVSS
uniref:Uncharacterized protein n=1 Tax=Salix viminalis TaxID=40686 RepID=A0A6N2N4F4_SALVM